MKTFTYSQCNNEFVLSIKKEYKQHDNDSSIKAKYNSLIGDTYIAIENLEEVLSDTDVLQELKVSIENEDTSFANTILGTSNYGNNDSCYRSYLTIDGKNVIEIRIANHYETKKTALEKSNNLSQFIYQVVLITDPPQPQQNDSITTTTTTAHLKILTKGVISKDASEEELSRLLKSIHDYLISPNSEWEISKTNNSQPINCKRNMNKKLIRLTESDLHRIVKESVQHIVSEASVAPNGFKHRFDPKKKDGDYPLKQPEWTKDPRWQGWKGEDPEWIMKQQKESGDPYYGNKQPVRVSEAQLHQIVKESVEQVLSEGLFGNLFKSAGQREFERRRKEAQAAYANNNAEYEKLYGKQQGTEISDDDSDMNAYKIRYGTTAGYSPDWRERAQREMQTQRKAYLNGRSHY